MKRTKTGAHNKQSHAHTDAMNAQFAMSLPTLLALYTRWSEQAHQELLWRSVEFARAYPGSNLGLALAELQKLHLWCVAQSAQERTGSVILEK